MWSWLTPLMTADFKSSCFGSIIAKPSPHSNGWVSKIDFSFACKSQHVTSENAKFCFYLMMTEDYFLLVVQSQPNCSTTSCAWIESWLNSSWTFAKTWSLSEYPITAGKKVTSGCPCLSVPATFPQAACFVQRCARWCRPLMQRKTTFWAATVKPWVDVVANWRRFFNCSLVNKPVS